jgi:hypothetical protein
VGRRGAKGGLGVGLEGSTSRKSWQVDEAGRYLCEASSVISLMRSSALAIAIVGLSAVLALACGTVQTPGAPTTIVVAESDAGKTVQAKVGDTVRVKLQEDFPVPGSSLVWDVSSSAPSVLAPGPVTRDPAQGPAVGHVQYQADFVAGASGQAELNAHGATTCEAMAKASCPDRWFTITVIVSS